MKYIPFKKSELHAMLLITTWGLIPLAAYSQNTSNATDSLTLSVLDANVILLHLNDYQLLKAENEKLLEQIQLLQTQLANRDHTVAVLDEEKRLTQELLGRLMAAQRKAEQQLKVLEQEKKRLRAQRWKLAAAGFFSGLLLALFVR